MNLFKLNFRGKEAILTRFEKEHCNQRDTEYKVTERVCVLDTEMLPPMKYFFWCNYFLTESGTILFIVGPRQCQAQTKKASKLIFGITYWGVRSPVPGMLCTLKN